MKKYTLITGASSGIGREFAFIAAREKRNLILVARGKAELNKVRLEILNIAQNEDLSIEVLSIDLSKPGSSTKVFEFCETKKLFIDELINNAGFGDYGKFAKSDIEKQTNMINLNITSLTEITRLFLPAMVKQGDSKIMNLGSVASFLPGPNMNVYYATKHFVLAFSEGLAEELSDSGVSVTCLCPGPTKTNFAKSASTENTGAFNNKRLPTPKEVALFGWYHMQQGERVAIHGARNKFVYYLARYLPRNLVSKMVSKFQN